MIFRKLQIMNPKLIKRTTVPNKIQTRITIAIIKNSESNARLFRISTLKLKQI